MRYVLDMATQTLQPDVGPQLPFVQSAENALVQPIANIVESVLEHIAEDIGRLIMHAIGPVSLIICCCFMLGVIMGADKAPRRALIWGLIASMAYGLEGKWS